MALIPDPNIPAPNGAPNGSPAPASDPPPPGPNVQDDVDDRGVFFRVDRVGPGWWRGELRLNVTRSTMTGLRCMGEGPTAPAAVEIATRFASTALADPYINAALPPGAQLAVHAVRDLARAAQRGELHHVVDHFGAPMLRAMSSLLSDVTHGTVSGFGPVCLVCADGSTPRPREYERGSPDFSDDKRFPGGPPRMPVPYDPGIPPGYPPPGSTTYDAAAAAAAVIGRARAAAHHHHHGHKRGGR